jgi:hypothetical protein
MEIINVVVLSLSALLLTYAGTTRLIKPIKSFCLKTYSDNPNVKLEGEVDIFNEMRGAGSSTTFGGLAIFLGVLIPQLRVAAFVVAIVIFLGHAFGRLVSSKLDGKPNQQLGQGLFSEMILGVANTVCLVLTLT